MIVTLLAATVDLRAQALDSLVDELLVPHFDPLSAMVKRRQVRALVHWSKTDYFIDRGEQRGFVYEMAHDFEAFLNKELRAKKHPVSVVIIPVSREHLVDYLEQGRGDISLIGTHETPELKGRVTFSAPLATNAAEAIIRHRSAAPIRGEDDLAGKTIHLRPSSKYASTVRSINRRLVARGLPEARIEPLSEHLADADILELLDAGLFSYTVLDDFRGRFWVTVFRHIAMDAGYRLADHEPLKFLLRNNTPKLKALVDRFIATHRIGTTYGNVLLKRYYSTNPWARQVLGADEVKRFRRTVLLFQRYGQRYGFDHLMLTAQGFQESRLDQSLKSRVGAIGVMQVMPSTGNEMRVGDIRQLEPNIHAGVKYMESLARTYFADPSLDPLNRALFCFAAYNAGPGRIAGFRTAAKRRGLDPNRWFDHVERIALEQGYRETAQYVVNITKYYVAYRLLEDRSAEREAAKRTQQSQRR
jgi:membrane-bound lytic murein transglycosylase MltF